MAQQALTEIDLETARKWFNVGVDVFIYKHGDDHVDKAKTRAEIALADYEGKVFFIDTKKHGKN